MRMVSLRRLAWFLLLATLGCESGQQPGATYTLSYEPPDSTAFTVELAMERKVQQGDSTSFDSTWTRTHHVQTATDGGYHLLGVTDSIAMFHNGVVVTDRIVNLFASAQIVYVIDSVGQALAVLGYEEIFAGLDSLVGEDTAAMIRQMINPQQLQQQEVASWNGKFAPFVNRRLQYGAPAGDTTVTSLPVEGQLASYQITEILDTVRINSYLCGRLRVASSTDPAELARLTDRSLEEVVEFFDLADSLITGATQRQAGASSVRDWVVEFETMLSHSESTRQVMFYYDLDQSNLPVRNQLTETQIKSFTY